MSFPHSVENFWRRKGIRSLLDYLGVPFGHNILTDQKPAEITNKTIDGNKNTLLNIGGGGGGSDNAGIVKVNGSPINAVARNLNLSSDFTGADNAPNVDIDIKDSTTAQKGIVQLATDNEADATKAAKSNDPRMSNARTPLAHTHVKADVTDFAHTHVKADITDFAHSHTAGDLPDASTSAKGIVQLANNNESTAGEVVQSNDDRMSNARTPLAHTHAEADITDLSIETAKIENDAVTYAKMQNVSAASKLLGRGDSGSGDPQEITLGTNLSITGTTLNASGGGGGEANTSSNVGDGDGQLAKAKVGVDLPFKTIKDGTNVDVVNNTDDVTINVPNASTTVKGAVELATDGESAASLAVQSNDTRMSNARTPTAHTHVEADITDLSIETAKIENNAVTYAKIQNVVDDDRVLGRVSGADGDIEELTGSQVTDLLRDASTSVKGVVQIATDAESNANEVCRSDDSRLSNARTPTSHTHVEADITDLSIETAKIENNAVDNTKLADMAANTVKVRAAGTTGDPSDLAISADNVLIRKSGNLVSDKIDTAQINDDQVTFAKVQNIATDKVLGRDTAASGNIEELGLDDTLEFDGAGNIRRAALTGDVTSPAGDNATTIANDAVTYAKIQNVVNDDRFLGRISGANGNVEEISPTDATALLDIFTATLKGIVPLSGGGSSNFLRADGTWAAPPAGGTVDTLPEDINLSGMITPSQITANQNDYNPTSWNVSWCMRLSSDASRDITGLTKTTTGRLALLINEGTQNIVLKNDNASSSATNRFKFGYGQDVVLRPEKCILLWHDATDDRWRMIGGTVNLREELVAQWDVSATKTNVGSTYVDVYTTTGSEGKPVYIDFTGYTHYRCVLYYNKVGSGTNSVKICTIANPTTEVLHDFSNAVSNENDSGLTALPSFAASGGRFELKMMIKSTTAADDPVVEGMRVYLI